MSRSGRKKLSMTKNTYRAPYVVIVVAVVCRLCEESIDLIKTIYEMKSSNVHFDEFRELLIFDL